MKSRWIHHVTLWVYNVRSEWLNVSEGQRPHDVDVPKQNRPKPNPNGNVWDNNIPSFDVLKIDVTKVSVVEVDHSKQSTMHKSGPSRRRPSVRRCNGRIPYIAHAQTRALQGAERSNKKILVTCSHCLTAFMHSCVLKFLFWVCATRSEKKNVYSMTFSMPQKDARKPMPGQLKRTL